MLRRTSRSLDEEEMHETGGDEPQGPRSSESTVRPELPGENSDEVNWDGPDDPTNPQNWPEAVKWRLTVLCAGLTMTVTFASSAPSSAIQVLQKEFGVGREVTELVTALFLAGFCAGPLIWAPGSELFGRRPIFILSLFLFMIFQIGCALAQNIATIIVIRFLTGVFSASPLTNAGGVIADIWDPINRGAAMSTFTASVFLGPIIGPFIGGFLTTSYLTWRWIFWLIMILSATAWICVILFFPETFAPVLLATKAKKLRKQNPEKNAKMYAPHERQDWSFRGVLQRTLYRPFHMLALEPILVLVTIYLSIVYGLLYGLFEAFPLIWADLRGFSPGLAGLIFIGVGIGSTSGALLNVWFSRKYRTLTPQWRGTPPPEYRLYGSMLGGPLLVIGIFFLGWTGAYKSVPWYVPALATPIIGAGITLVFISFLTYIVDCYLMYAASGLAANTIVRSAIAAAFPLFTVQMFESLGIQWACTLIGCVALVLAPSPFFFFKYGARIRQKSRFAPAPDLKVAQDIEEEKRRAEA
ncbi:MFS general substrate transporter [Punctularia strigosozonata HHB-11173 SS5]|uniref:MFS general substrate transporter n=1 Tax=Punctularia strigosozonata (strain HHB-11173) TaxID=741275 RepID=UPI0004416CDF|nr:MFS general substrate transporter [Punctularia strigosozonata HHB-11173 SS5]EIN07969.1 MFS general substrate transporter [Punctularia strigosozonata HHB-11173 SS5]